MDDTLIHYLRGMEAMLKQIEACQNEIRQFTAHDAGDEASSGRPEEVVWTGNEFIQVTC